MDPARKFVVDAQHSRIATTLDNHYLLNDVSHKDIETTLQAIGEYRVSGTRPSEGYKVDHQVLQQIALAFHQKAGTLTPQVSTAIDSLGDSCARLHLGHQVNVFSSLGVVSQFIFLDSLTRAIETRLSTRACQMYVYVDYDTANDSRFKVAHVPDIKRDGGSLSLSNAVLKQDHLKPMWAVCKPPAALLSHWVDSLRQLFKSDVTELNKMGVVEKQRGATMKHLALVEKMIWEAYERASTLVEFNAFFLSRLVNVAWQIPCIFLPGSQLQPTMQHAYEYLLSLYPRISQLAAEGKDLLARLNITAHSINSSPQPSLPIWLTCSSCTTRVALIIDKGNLGQAYYRCSQCHHSEKFNLGTYSKPDLTPIAHLVSPRILLDNLLDIVALRADGGTGYIGQAEHLLLTSHVAHGLGWELPPHCLWQPKGVYYGSAECRAGLLRASTNALEREVRRIDAACSWAFSGKASILYYLVNHGATSVLEMWRRHFDNGKDVHHFNDVRNYMPFECPASAIKQLIQMARSYDI